MATVIYIHLIPFLRDSTIRDGIFPVLNILIKIRDASTELFHLRDVGLLSSGANFSRRLTYHSSRILCKTKGWLRDLSTEHFRIFKGFSVLNFFEKSLKKGIRQCPHSKMRYQNSGGKRAGNLK